jgi:hypothetical protein
VNNTTESLTVFCVAPEHEPSTTAVPITQRSEK